MERRTSEVLDEPAKPAAVRSSAAISEKPAAPSKPAAASVKPTAPAVASVVKTAPVVPVVKAAAPVVAPVVKTAAAKLDANGVPESWVIQVASLSQQANAQQLQQKLLDMNTLQ